jgi:hypothetical protein
LAREFGALSLSTCRSNSSHVLRAVAGRCRAPVANALNASGLSRGGRSLSSSARSFRKVGSVALFVTGCVCCRSRTMQRKSGNLPVLAVPGGTMTIGRPDVNSIASIMVRAAMGRSDDPLSKFYREIGISALAAALDRESHEKHGRGECGVVGFK